MQNSKLKFIPKIQPNIQPEKIYIPQTIDLSYRETFVALQKYLKIILHFYHQIRLYQLVLNGVGIILLIIQIDSSKNVDVGADLVENGTIAKISSTVFTTYAFGEAGGGVYF